MRETSEHWSDHKMTLPSGSLTEGECVEWCCGDAGDHYTCDVVVIVFSVYNKHIYVSSFGSSQMYIRVAGHQMVIGIITSYIQTYKVIPAYLGRHTYYSTG